MAALVKNAISTAALPVTFPATSLGQQLAQVAQMIRSRTQLGAKRQIFFASLGGFDTHTDQLNSQTALYQQLSDAISAFSTAMADSSIAAADDVTLFTESEFNRTFQPNTNGGTDHAWGGHHMVVGGAVKGGLYGQFPNLALGGESDSRKPRQLDSDHLARPIWRYAGAMVRREQLAWGFPQSEQFQPQSIQSWICLAGCILKKRTQAGLAIAV